MSSEKYLLVVGGPTASGKTGFAIRLARHFGTEILSVDSRQFYQEMSIGTAKPTAEELSAVPHHFVNHLSIHDQYSVGDFEREALDRLAQLFSKYSVVIATGGSGLYLKALCEGLDEFPPVPASLRQEVEALYQAEGLEALQKSLRDHDPEYYNIVDLQNPHRLIRALSVCRSSGRPFSSFLAQPTKTRDFTPIYLQLYWPRSRQYERINQRVDLMMKEGQLEEAQRLLRFRHLSALQTVGYQELFDHLEGQYSLEESIELIKRNTRRYAKRQLTWMRRDGFWKHLYPSEWELALRFIQQATEKNFRIRTASKAEKLDLLRSHLLQKSPALNPENIEFLVAEASGSIWQAIPLLFQQKEVLQFPSISVKEPEEAQTALLWHEARARAEGRPLFYLSKTEPTAFQTQEPQLLPLADLPSRIHKWIPRDHLVWQLTK